MESHAKAEQRLREATSSLSADKAQLAADTAALADATEALAKLQREFQAKQRDEKERAEAEGRTLAAAQTQVCVTKPCMRFSHA